MDANSHYGMAMPSFATQTLASHHIEVKSLTQPHQSHRFFPSSQPSMPHLPPVAETVISPAVTQHQSFDPHYLHQQQQNFVYNDNQINTLFVAGLPDDVKAREIHNLFRRRPGFEYCQLKYTGRGDQVVAFAIFINHQSAMAALNALNGVTFDPETGATLHIELAKSNSRRKRTPGNGGYVIIDNRSKVASEAKETKSYDGDSGSDEPSDTDNFNSSNKGEIATAESGGTAGVPKKARAAVKEESKTTVAGEVRPCSTLFIANLGPNCTEEEIKQAVSQYPGFNGLKMRARGGMPVAFADFENIEFATEAMQSLQDSVLPSSDRGGLHIEYARSKMRKP